MAALKIDENLPDEVAATLAAAGHDAVTVVQQAMGGKIDPQIASICQAESRTLVTLDLDFADIRNYPPADYCGIVVLRLTRQDKLTILDAVTRMLPLFGQEELSGKLWIVEDATVRIRS